jgi:hypothetical protein
MDILAGIVENGKTMAKTYAGHYIYGFDATGRYAINNEPQGEVVVLCGPNDEWPDYQNGYWRGTDGHGVIIGQQFGVLRGPYLVKWVNDDDDLSEWVRFALYDYRSNQE